MPSGIGLANKFLNFKKSLMPSALKWTCERYPPPEALVALSDSDVVNNNLGPLLDVQILPISFNNFGTILVF
jgi:hypothetical protein